jgi:hypothetical protein
MLEKRSPQPQKSEVSKVYQERLKPISKDKNVAAIIEKMANHIERKNNIDFEIEDKKQEKEALKEQADHLADQYKFDLNRETMRAKAEVENEINIVESERTALLKTQYHQMNNWRVELSPEEAQILEKAYEPIGVKERTLFTELQKKAAEYIKAFESFKKEYDGNLELHNTLSGLVSLASNGFVKLNRVREDEILELTFKVNNLD